MSMAEFEYESGAETAVTKGRPPKDINKDQVEYLRTLRFTWSEISSLLGTSLSTREWNIVTFSTISDIDLDILIRSIITQFPQSGEVMVCGHVRSRKVGMHTRIQ